MTPTKLDVTTDQTTGDVEVLEERDADGKVLFRVKGAKKEHEFVIHKAYDGYPFYEIKVVFAGPKPKDLQGKFTSPEAALEVLMKHFRRVKYTPTAYYNKVQKDKKSATKKLPKDS